jgi:hypothetical protein
MPNRPRTCALSMKELAEDQSLRATVVAVDHPTCGK